MGDMCTASGCKEMAYSNHKQYFGVCVWGGGTSLPQSHISMLHLKLQLLLPWLQQHSHADLNICTNPLIRSPAQTHILEFNCLPLSYFHSQIPKMYTLQTWYSPFLCHSFLCLQSSCHSNINAKPTGYNTMPTAFSMR